MKAPVLITIVVALHMMALAAFVFIQGCGTQRGPIIVESPPSPVMPPKRHPRRSIPPVSSRLIPPGERPVRPIEVPPEFNPKTYIIKKGDSLSRIAKRHNISTQELIDLNQLKNPDNIWVGQKLLLPPYATGVTVPQAPVKRASTPRRPVIISGSESTYVVQSGDSLSKIAFRNGTTVPALREANQIKGDRILIGQKLLIPGTKKKSAPLKQPAPSTERAIVKEIIQLEDVIEERRVLPEAPAEPPVSPVEQIFEHTVREGETPDSIAKDFAVLKEEILQLNNIEDEVSIKPGQKLKIPPMDY
ncbi:MAG: LysM peptidoglycan-binding domain-containing protein [Kiritimatiellae bacterium]|nr:LysM peptidoglycan-binding domain-containing protein [Kiritimatiellia bacterium]